MKRHIVRSMETDRYGFTVPTKLSELEDDIVVPYIEGSSYVTLTAPGPDGPLAFPVANTTFGTVNGFTTPSGTDLDIVIPETGIYLLSCVFSWLSTDTSGSGVGRLTTPGTYQLLTVFAGSVLGAIDGTYLRDNKLGPLTTDPGDIAVSVAAAIAGPLTAGDVISPQAAAVAIAGNVNARIQFSILRVA